MKEYKESEMWNKPLAFSTSEFKVFGAVLPLAKPSWLTHAQMYLYYTINLPFEAVRSYARVTDKVVE